MFASVACVTSLRGGHSSAAATAYARGWHRPGLLVLQGLLLQDGLVPYHACGQVTEDTICVLVAINCIGVGGVGGVGGCIRGGMVLFIRDAHAFLGFYGYQSVCARMLLQELSEDGDVSGWWLPFRQC